MIVVGVPGTYVGTHFDIAVDATYACHYLAHEVVDRLGAESQPVLEVSGLARIAFRTGLRYVFEKGK